MLPQTRCGTSVEGGFMAWAQSPSGPVDAAEHATELTCYGCEGALSFVKQHVRVVNGISRNVVSHFRHVSRSECHQNETALHKAAKHALCLHWNTWTLHRSCCKCGASIPILYSGDTCAEPECTFGKLRLDVGARRAGTVVECVEVLVTHAVPDDKVRALNEAGLIWCEVHAADVLSNLTTRSVSARRCAVDVCCECLEKVARQVESQARLALQLDEPGAFRATVDQLRQKRIEALRIPMSPWACFAADLRAAAVQLAEQHGIASVEAVEHVEAFMQGADGLLTFGKHKGRYVTSLCEEDRPYVLWLAGYDFGRADGNRPAKRKAGNGAHLIPVEIERCAKSLVEGSCFRCGEETGESWKTWCRGCFPEVVRE